MGKMKWVLVTGASEDLEDTEAQAAREVGVMLATTGYGLIVGDWSGVDEIVAKAFLDMIPERDHAARIQHVANHPNGHSIRVEGAGVLDNDGFAEDYSRAAVLAADAGIVVSGRSGSKPAMDALLQHGKPALPVAFLGRDGFELFREVLSAWTERPVPGLTERQFLELARPWQRGAKPLARLLMASLTRRPHIFLSYRRADVPAAAGRIFDQLAHTFGHGTVFIDYEHLRGGQEIERIIRIAKQCKVFVGIIGPNWEKRGFAEDDYVRREFVAARSAKADVLPVLIQRRDLPSRDVLPPEMQFILDLNISAIETSEWQVGVERLRETIDLELLG